ncbi:sodium channel protein type 4 subunit alpha B-like, partial [Plectropomus leopardus]|uniref:sodium channel protein type 4 subunit alpha B-like n=1 Tax=Plectropomus leopardus TaxID=160734 RepID=UPI001C4CB7AC
MTGDGFDIIYAAVDTRQVESQLVYESKPYAHLYFIFFTVFGVFFTFNFIIRHIMDNLLRDKSAGRRLFVTEEQQKFWAVMKMRALRPQKAVPRPQGVCRAGLFDLVTGAPFSVLMAVVICLNMVVLMIETRDQSETMDIVLSWLHFVFILIFLIEFILKIIALGRHYFSDGYNVLDFLVLIITIVVSSNDVIISSDDVTVSSNDVSVSSDDVTVSSDDVTVSSGDVTLSSDDVTLSSGDVTVSSDDVTVSSDDVIVSS